MWKKGSIVAYALLMGGVVVWQACVVWASYHSAGKAVTVELTRGPFVVLDFASRQPTTRAVILFGSGDGGWSSFEEQICLTLQKRGYEVLGINCHDYAASDYDLAILQSDFDRMAQAAVASKGPHPPPVIIGGWSMGAAQAIAAAGGPNRPQRLAGVLTIDPCSRGRYGLRVSDRADFLPTGPGTFGVGEFATTMDGLRLVQWHADRDSIDSRVWLAALTAPHREIDFAASGHYYNADREQFLSRLADSVSWILERDSGAVTTAGSKR